MSSNAEDQAPGSKKRLLAGDDNDEDDEEDEEYDEDEDEDEEEDEDDDEEEDDRGRRRSKKRAKRSKPSLFADAAEEGSDEEEEEGEGEIGSDEGFDALTPAQREERARRVAQEKRFRESTEEDIKRIAKELQKRSLQQHKHTGSAMGRTTGGAATIETARLLRERPTAEDPKLFLIRCRPGGESQILIKLYNKYFKEIVNIGNESSQQTHWARTAQTGSPQEIYSILATGASGYIYVESDSEDNVKAALRGVLGAYASRCHVVPLEEMEDVLRIAHRKNALKVDDYVRIRSPFPFKGDLAKVVAIRDGGERIIVKVVPRIDMTRLSVTFPKKDPKAHQVPPPAKHFNADEIRALGGFIEREQKDGVMRDKFDEHYFENGLMLLELKQGQVQQLTEKPSVAELELFIEQSSAAAGGDGLEAITSEVQRVASKQRVEANAFAVGDKVKVIRGPEAGAEGVLKDVDSLKRHGTVIVGGGLSILISFRDLTKRFDMGDHVKVIKGKHLGKTGTVVSVPNEIPTTDSFVVHIYTDTTAEELEVLNNELVVSAEVSAGVSELNGYKLFDLVMLDQNVHGVVVRINPDSVGILNQMGEVRTVPTSSIRAKKTAESLRATAPDANNQMLRSGDRVHIVAGPYRNADGVIKHIFRMMLFLQNKERDTENQGIFVVKSKDCRLAGSVQATNRPMAPPTNRTFNPNMGRGKMDSLQGKTVRIRRGNDKGLVGMVLAGGNATSVRVELNARNRIVYIPREDVEVVETKPLASMSMPPPTYNAPAYGAPRYGAPPPYAYNATGGSSQVYATPMGDFESKPLVPPVEAPPSAKTQYKADDEVTIIATGEPVTIVEVMDKDIVIKDSSGKIRIVSSSDVVYG